MPLVIGVVMALLLLSPVASPPPWVRLLQPHLPMVWRRRR
jgi:hypothetical protein